jgi:hypothetical protein
MKEVLHNPDDFDETTKRQAQFMKNILKWTIHNLNLL